MTAPGETPAGSGVEPLDERRIDRYLQRIGLTARPEVSPAGLRELVHAHLWAVPFENLSISRGERIVLDTDLLFDKIVVARRGGFCYELNGLFAALLAGLGFRVSLLAGRMCRPDGSLGRPFDHLAVRIHDPDEGDLLVDVGLGRPFADPLRLVADEEQAGPVGRFRLVAAASDELVLEHDGTPQYQFDLHPRRFSDFVGACDWQQSDPASEFRRGPLCSRMTPTWGLITIAGRRLIRTEGGERHESILDSDQALRAAHRDLFGLALA